MEICKFDLQTQVKTIGRSSALFAVLISQDFAYEADQKYKEGRFILEREMVTERPEPRSAHARPTIEEHLPVRELMARV